jgi:hypothetical protein
MENLEIIILSTIVTTLFIIFFFTMWRELNEVSKNPPTYSKESGPRADMIKFVGTLFDEKTTNKMSSRQKNIMYKAVKETIADMESDGVYFPIEVKKELESKRKELTCEYSGLPSVKSYDVNQILNK